MDGTGGVAAVQARITQIVARFQAPPATGGVLGAAEARETADFATTLARAQSGSGAAPARAAAPSDGAGLNRAGVVPTQWSRDFLERLGMPITAENVRAVDAWQQAEGTRARFNPLATTQGWPGATQFNSVGVKNFATYEDGLAASVKVINNGRYENILAALRRGSSAEDVARAIADGPWGSGDLVQRILRG